MQPTAIPPAQSPIGGDSPLGTDPLPSGGALGSDALNTNQLDDSALTSGDSTNGAGSLISGDVDITPGMTLPLPDDAAAAAARDRLTSIDIGVSAPTLAALGMLGEAVVFIAGVQGSAYPRPLLSTRVVLFTGSHAGGVVAGPAPDPRHAVPLQHLAVTAGAGVVTLEWQPAAAAIELEDAITPEQMNVALRAGWEEAERAADEGIELLVVAAGGAGGASAATAVIAATTGAEPTMLLGRVVTPAGLYDDNAWMTRCLALRDALHRVRARDGGPRTVLTALGGADIAAATGLVLGAASRRTPVMIDGPVGAAAALLANDFSPQSRRWVVLPDTGRQPAVRMAAEALELRPWLDLCLDLGEGAAALAALPMLQTALTLAGVGEPVEATPLTHFDSSGNQVFVGVARPVEPATIDEGPAEVDAGDDRSTGTDEEAGVRSGRDKQAPTARPTVKAKEAASKPSGQPTRKATAAKDAPSRATSGTPAKSPAPKAAPKSETTKPGARGPAKTTKAAPAPSVSGGAPKTAKDGAQPRVSPAAADASVAGPTPAAEASPAGAAPASDRAASGPAVPEPAGADPAVSRPAATDTAASNTALSSPAASNHAASNHAASNHAVTDRTVADHAGHDHAGDDHTGHDHTVADHAGDDHAGDDHVSADGVLLDGTVSAARPSSPPRPRKRP